MSFADSNINSNAKDYLTHIQLVLNAKTNDLKTHFTDNDFNDLAIYLTIQKGLIPENAYLYLRGHTLYEKVLQSILRKI